MLPRANRLTSGEQFRRAVRAGRRAGSRTLVLHLVVEEGPAGPPGPPGSPGSPGRSGAAAAQPARVGFVVSRAVGNAVLRNRVRRRLRHLTQGVLPQLPASSLLVVRALPAATEAGSGELRADLTRCLGRVLPEVA